MNSQYESQFVERLFDKMSASYSKMNYISSFGFSERWRKKCVKEIDFTKSKIVVDLLTGMGECWKYIDREVNKDATIIGLDFSKEMIKQAKNNALKFKQRKIEVLKENVFENSIKTNSADVIISGFGLKTFNEKQLIKLGEEVKNAKNIEVIFKDLNFEVEYVEYFFGCASGIKGYKK